MNLDANRYAHDLLDLFQSGEFKKIIDLSVELGAELANNPLAHDVIAASNFKLGHLEAAITHYSRSLLLEPNNPESSHNLAVIYMDLGRFDNAIDCFNNAVASKADYVQAHFGIGNIYQIQKLHEKAIQKYQTVLDLEPEYEEALNNLGATFLEIGKPKEAVPFLQRLVAKNPQYGDAFFNLGLAHKLNGDEHKAIENFAHAVDLKPDDSSFWETLGSALSISGVSNLPYDSFYETVFLNLLKRKSTHNPHIIAPAILQFLFKNPIFAQHVRNGSEIKNNNDLCAQVIKDFASLPLALKLMELCPIADLRIERLFTECRKIILFNLQQDVSNHDATVFLNSLALQCYTNEYVYWQTDGEKKKVDEYIQSIDQELKNEVIVDDKQIAIIACYYPLNRISWSSKLKHKPINRELLTRQIENNRQEKMISKSIPAIKEITNKTSSQVRQQYEENPYPRWVNTTVFSNPSAVYDCLANIGLSLTDDVKEIKAPRILIAGCGTGKHALITASRFQNSTVTALDLSLSSLSYAKRKTSELGVKNVDYLQGDILDLCEESDKYDIVESSGVLHHMEHPEDGLKKLIALLKPGGIMRLGLYSEYARQGVVSARKFIAQQDIGGTIEDKIRAFRKSITDEDKTEGEKILFISKWSDFYSMSECRDLFFHVKEHRFTLPQIKTMLEEMSLSFIGFEFSGNPAMDDFTTKFTDKDAALSLDLWDQYEKENPSTFLGMYQFWVRKFL